MDIASISIISLLVLAVLLGSGVWVAISLMGVGLAGMVLFTDAPTGRVMATTVWGSSSLWTLTALPLFVWMGEILFRTRLSEDLFNGLAPWVSRVPGRLLHVNVIGCAIFAAVCGSSAATAATIGRMSLPELLKRGYDEKLAIGSLAGSATLGLLIPPSIIMIVYGVAAEVPIIDLFIAGIVPGLVLVALFMGYIGLWALANPERMPQQDQMPGFRERLQGLAKLLPIIILIIGVIAAMYGGYATATEAAAVGVAGALILAALTGTLNRKSFWESLVAATRLSCMIAFILAGASFMTISMGFTGVPRHLAEWVGSLGLSTSALITVLTILFVVLGCFLDGISVVVLTASIILPTVQQAGIDLLWFGIYIVIVVEMAQITPPVGFNLFVIQGLFGQNILQIARSTFPFFLLMVVAVAMITIFPELVTTLPSIMRGG